jgi:hypothetical protein
MNHVKNIELFEARNFKDCTKYNKYLSIKYYDDTILPSPGIKRKNEVSIFSESNQITITIKYEYTISNVALLKLCKDFEHLKTNGNVTFKVYPAKSAVVFEAYNVPISYFDQIDMEIASKKYNI